MASNTDSSTKLKLSHTNLPLSQTGAFLYLISFLKPLNQTKILLTNFMNVKYSVNSWKRKHRVSMFSGGTILRYNRVIDYVTIRPLAGMVKSHDVISAVAHFSVYKHNTVI